jgi:hypothetical protein
MALHVSAPCDEGVIRSAPAVAPCAAAHLAFYILPDRLSGGVFAGAPRQRR